MAIISGHITECTTGGSWRVEIDRDMADMGDTRD